MQATNLIKFLEETHFFFDTRVLLGPGTNLGSKGGAVVRVLAFQQY